MKDEIDEALLLLQRAIMKHPVAAQAIYSAFVREGRAYSQTEEGSALRACLLASESTSRLQTAWEILTLGMLDAEPRPGALPSVLVDALVQSVFRTRFEARLSSAIRNE